MECTTLVPFNEEVPSQFRAILISLEDLCDFHDWYFCSKAEKQALLHDKISSINTMLSSINEELQENNQSLHDYIKGKALNCLESYSNEAEELLSASIKLQPKRYDAWNSLGQCLWKKGDLVQARNCFLESINQMKNKEALLELSILMRQIHVQGQSPTASVEESINLAKQAITLDINDHKAWYILGNAWCTRFFSTSYDTMDLQKALSCYRRSEQLGGTRNPDLYMNRGNVLRYLQGYNGAITAFNNALSLDPSMVVANTAIIHIQTFQTTVNEVVSTKGNIKVARLNQLLKNLLASPYSKLSSSVSSLSMGINSGKFIILKPLQPLSISSNPPHSFLCIDITNQLTIFSVYDIASASPLSQIDIIYVQDPFLLDKSINGEVLVDTGSTSNTSNEQLEKTEKKSLFRRSPTEGEENKLDIIPIIQLFDISKLRINDKYLTKTAVAPPELKITTFDA